MSTGHTVSELCANAGGFHWQIRDGRNDRVLGICWAFVSWFHMWNFKLKFMCRHPVGYQGDQKNIPNTPPKSLPKWSYKSPLDQIVGIGVALDKTRKIYLTRSELIRNLALYYKILTCYFIPVLRGGKTSNFLPWGFNQLSHTKPRFYMFSNWFFKYPVISRC